VSRTEVEAGMETVKRLTARVAEELGVQFSQLDWAPCDASAFSWERQSLRVRTATDEHLLRVSELDLEDAADLGVQRKLYRELRQALLPLRAPRASGR
jgi:hypothetical protein